MAETIILKDNKRMLIKNIINIIIHLQNEGKGLGLGQSDPLDILLTLSTSYLIIL